MNFWTFIIVIVIIIVAGDVIKKALKGPQTNKSGTTTEKEIEKLKIRIDELNNFTLHRIEERVQAIETIVVSSEYNLDMKFKRMIEGD